MKKYIIELSDNELKIVTEKELKEMEKSAIEFDGFEGWIVKGELLERTVEYEKRKGN